ncbi:MAG: DUF3025 domain-containing protein [Candidatus Accumulibacter sp.]|uniref:DUF3025 domain-containing protein n=1 Tax=Candidatus Accumulibacter proximus TaxID=2954385 RepID=A0A935PZ78_9PROT|nr:DUF3025 domain-containing protein [Candidatus Accumulibacter proximus]
MSRADFPSPGGLYAPLSSLLEQIPFAPDPGSLTFLNSTRDLRTHSGQRISFVPPPADGLAYEARIWTRGEVATRPGNWHDFFNALVWLTFPLAKAALNARHAGALAPPASPRGRARDAMTHFDECGVVVVSSDPDLLALLRDFQWSALFWGRRSDLGRRLRCFVVGHATYEQLLQPFRGLTAKAVLYEVTPAWLSRPLAAQVSAIDQRLAVELAAGEHMNPRAFHPLPLMGWPGVTADSETAAYYDDRWQFRPGRSRPGV